MDNELVLYDRLNVIRDVIRKHGEEKFYVSFSGGKDSTVLHYLIDEALPDNKIPRIYINTGIEYIDILKHVKKVAENDKRIVIYNAGVNIPQMLKKYGFPFKSKEHSNKLSTYQRSGNQCKVVKKYLSKNEFSCPDILRYQFNDDFHLKISDRCCHKLKKEVAHRYEKESGRKSGIVGLRMSEGGQRANKRGCVVFKANDLVRFKPINPVSDEWIDWYIQKRNIELCKLYYPPFSFERTGCKGCPYSLHLQEQLEVMERLLPNERKQCELIWKPVYEEYRRIGYRLKKEEQIRLF